MFACTYSCGGILLLARWRWTLCSCAAVQNEVHVLFTLSRLVYVLSQKEVYVPFSQPSGFSVEAPNILQALPSQTVLDSLSLWPNKLCHFISDIMDDFLTGLPISNSATPNQPNDQAGG